MSDYAYLLLKFGQNRASRSAYMALTKFRDFAMFEFMAPNQIIYLFIFIGEIFKVPHLINTLSHFLTSYQLIYNDFKIEIKKVFIR